ncbi:MAG: hypothetical protein KGI02_08005 [Thaumarchaeota archaeon]|nr:hypothetical protein [Nitrososphaerota archaeon]MDE1832295.1 hypothetical protein [Nitrososphaerota archaeon]MDE1841431.1 hypothetical protein [Nitrososphaerota archaeon]MDE1878629.1 hypothetical protein [Nitrososphaerota archaeon]
MSIKVYHRGIKQCCVVERSHVRKARSIVNHILLPVRAFLRLETYRIETGTSWYDAKNDIIRSAIRRYLSSPFCDLGSTNVTPINIENH